MHKLFREWKRSETCAHKGTDLQNREMLQLFWVVWYSLMTFRGIGNIKKQNLPCW